jgi:hypothetical protein
MSGFRRNRSERIDRLPAIMVLLAYLFTGGFTGFAPSIGGHLQVETVHLPNVARDSGILVNIDPAHVRADVIDFEARRASAETLQSDPPGAAASVAATSRTVTSSATALSASAFWVGGKAPLAKADLTHLLSVLAEALFARDQDGLQPFVAAEAIASANPGPWLRTVVLTL